MKRRTEQEHLSRDIRLFIAEHIHSIEQLEVLLLARSAPQQEWSVESVYGVVKSSRTSVSERLKDLVKNGFLAEVQGEPLRYRFQPRNERLEQLVSDLAIAYKEHSVRVIEAIYSRSAASLREFAHAFRIKPKE